MSDFQIARNLGEMFETATRKLNFPSAVSGALPLPLPASVTSFINTNYYNVETNFTTKEIVTGLESSNDNEVYTVLKHLVGRLATCDEREDDDDDEDEVDDIDVGNVPVNASNNDSVVKEIVQLFPHIVKNVNSTNLKIKRLVYTLLLRFNHLQQDISLLSINAIQKSLVDKNAINRSLAIRCLSGIKIPAILPILLLSLGKMIKDSSPLVRSACCIAIVKCVRLDIQYNIVKPVKKMTRKKRHHQINRLNESGKVQEKAERDYIVENLRMESSNISQLYNSLDALLSDDDAKVVSTAIVAYHDVFNGCFDIWHNKIPHLVEQYEFLESDAKMSLLDIMTEYIPLFYGTLSSLDSGARELVMLYESAWDGTKTEMDANVILSVVKFITKNFRFEIDEGQINLAKVMIKLLQRDYKNDISDDSKIAIVLEMTLQLLQEGLLTFTTHQLSNFIPLTSDNALIFDLKVATLFEVIDESNFTMIFRELRFVIDRSSANHVRKYKILKQINNLILRKSLSLDQFSTIVQFFMAKLQTEKDELLVGEYITGMRQFIQGDLEYYIEILVKLVGKLVESYSTGANTATTLLDNAKSSIIWLVGELVMSQDLEMVNGSEAGARNETVHTLLNAVPDLCLLLVRHFCNERNSGVRYQILTLVTKTQLMSMRSSDHYEVQGNRFFQLFNYVLQLSKYDADLDVRDSSRLIGGLLPNVVYYSDVGLSELDVDRILSRDGAVREHCVDATTTATELATLMLQTTKPRPQASPSALSSTSAPWLSIHTCGVLDRGYAAYYAELRESGFELRRHVGWARSRVSLVPMSSSLSSSSSVPVVAQSQSQKRESGGRRSDPRMVRLQTLDDFLSDS